MIEPRPAQPGHGPADGGMGKITGRQRQDTPAVYRHTSLCVARGNAQRERMPPWHAQSHVTAHAWPHVADVAVRTRTPRPPTVTARPPAWASRAGSPRNPKAARCAAVARTPAPAPPSGAPTTLRRSAVVSSDPAHLPGRAATGSSSPSRPRRPRPAGFRVLAEGNAALRSRGRRPSAWRPGGVRGWEGSPARPPPRQVAIGPSSGAPRRHVAHRGPRQGERYDSETTVRVAVTGGRPRRVGHDRP